MEIIDIILGGLLIYGFTKGIYKGLFAELASVIALLAGLFIAIKFSGMVASAFGATEGKPGTAGIVIFLLTFAAAVVGIILLAKVFTKLASAGGLGWLNYALGGLFGAIKICLIVSVLLNFFQTINSTHIFASEETLNNSLFFYPVLSVSGYIFPILKVWFS